MAKAPSNKKAQETTRKLAIEIARQAADNRAEDVVVLDLRGRSPVTDFFVIATGGSDRQRRTVAEDTVDLAKQNGQPVLNVSGLDQPDWILVDMADIVLHVFDADARTFYDLDLLWGDAPKLRWKRPAKPAQPASDDENV